MIYILSFLMVFSIVVIIHELGHYIAAKATGVKVYEFSIGFPFSPKVLTLFRHRETEFTVRLLPLGGFVAFSKNGQEDIEFLNESRWKRALISIAGPAFNIVFAFIMIIIALLIGKDIGLLAASMKSLSISGSVFTGTFELIYKMISGASAEGLAGPVGIALAAGQAAQAGLADILYFSGLLSLSLAVFNLLPLPALDGGSLVILAIETLKRKRLTETAYSVIGFAGFSLIIILTVVVSYQDIVKLAA